MIRLPISASTFAAEDPTFILDFLMNNGKDRYDFWFDESGDVLKWLVPVYGELPPTRYNEGTLFYEGLYWASMSDVRGYSFAVVNGTIGMALYLKKQDIQHVLDGTLCIKFNVEERAFCIFTLALVE